MYTSRLMIFPLALVALLQGCGHFSGNARLAAGDYPGAEAEFRRILAQDPDDAVAARRLGQTLYRSGRYRDAADVLAASLARHPGLPEETLYLGLARLAAGDQDQGFETLAGFSHPDTYRITQAVREEAGRLRAQPWPGPGEAERRLLDAWAQGERMEALDRRSFD